MHRNARRGNAAPTVVAVVAAVAIGAIVIMSWGGNEERPRPARTRARDVNVDEVASTRAAARPDAPAASPAASEPTRSPTKGRATTVSTIDEPALAPPTPDEPDDGRIHWTALCEPGCGGRMTSITVSPHDPARAIVAGDMLGVGLSTDGCETWGPTFGFLSWEMGDVTFHPTNPKVVWVGSMSGPYKSEDGGRTWVEKRAGFPKIQGYSYSAPVEKVLFDPNDTKRLIAVGGSHRRWNSPGKPSWGAVWESTDGGESWSHIATVSGGANIVAAAFAAGSSSVLLAAAAPKGVWRSDDGGRTWSASNAGLPHTHVDYVATHPADPDVAWAALVAGPKGTDGRHTPGGVYRSDDGGRTWVAGEGLTRRRDANGSRTSRYMTLAVAPTDPDHLFTTDCSWNVGILYLSRDGGRTWNGSLTRGGVDCAYTAGFTMWTMTYDPANARVAYMAGDSYILKTTDGGSTWTDATSYHPDGTSAWRGRGYSGLCTKAFRFHPTDAKRSAFAAMDHGNFWQSRDSLRSWTWGGDRFPSWGGGNDVAFAGGKTIFVTVGQGGDFKGIMRTRDDGARWQTLAGARHGLPELGAKGKALGIYAPCDASGRVWAAVGGKLYWSTDGGESWRVVCDGPGLSVVEGVRAAPGRIFAAGSSGVYESADGEAFTRVPGGPRDVRRLDVDTSDPPRVYVACWRSKTHGGLWRYADGAWTRLRDDAFIGDVAVDPTDPRRIAVTTDDHPYHDHCYATGVWVSSDGGATWEQQNDGLPVTRGGVITFDPHDPERLVLGTGGRGYFVGRWRK